MGWLRGPPKRVLAKVRRRFRMDDFAERYFAPVTGRGGADPAGTLKRTPSGILGKLRKRGFAFTLDALGEATISEKEADGYASNYLELLDALVGLRRLPMSAAVLVAASRIEVVARFFVDLGSA